MNVSNPTPDWSPVKRFFFRFAFVYLILYILCAGNNFPRLFQDFWNVVVPSVGAHMFGVSVPAWQLSGSSDTTFDYVQSFCLAGLAAAAAAVWSLLDRKSTHHARLHAGLRVGVRFVLAWWMISYGAAKVIPVQMTSPSLFRLLQPLGDSSPAGLLWTFMGASAAYTIFTGAAEILGGLLLTARRTTLLGALVCIAVLSNVVMLNFSYGVCVKLFSTHLLVMAVFLILPDLGRLTAVFFSNRRVKSAPDRPLFARPWLNRVVLALRTVLVVYATYFWLSDAYEDHITAGNGAPKPPLYVIWNVEEFTIDGEVRPPLTTDATRWRRAIVENSLEPAFSIQLMNDAHQVYGVQVDVATNTLALTKPDDPAWQATVSYQEPESGSLKLEGTLDGHTIRASLRRVDESQFALRQGFRWVIEPVSR
jgi:hypothetical protein